MTVTVQDKATCAGLTALFRDRDQSNKTNVLGVASGPGNTFTAGATAGTGDYKGSGSGPYYWEFEMKIGSDPVTYTGSPLTLLVN